ncbi:hypothetical protein [uncultured Nostoc sp.]
MTPTVLITGAMLGSANLSQALYRLFPGLIKWVLRQGLKNQDN